MVRCGRSSRETFGGPVFGGAHSKTRQALLTLAVIGLMAGALHYVFNPRTLERYTEMELRLERVRAMNRRIAEENESLARYIEACRHDPRYLERLARQELGQIRDGDVVYVFPVEPDAPPP